MGTFNRMSTTDCQDYIVPDVLQPGLVTVFCGRAPSPESARRRAYYAHFSNKFWEILAETGLTDRLLEPEDYHLLPQYGIGLTDINKTEFGSDHELSGSGDNPLTIHDKMLKYRPQILAFNGKNNFRMYSHAVHQTVKSAPVEFGCQSTVHIERTEVWVLPNTSARARGYWDSLHWHALAERHFEKMSECEIVPTD